MNRIMKILLRLKDKYLRRETILAMDTIISIIVSGLVCYGLRHFTEAPPYTVRFMTLYMGTSIVASIFFFLLFKTYRIVIRHLSIRDLVPFTLATACIAATIFLVMTIFGFYSHRLVLLVIMDFFFTAAALLGVRLLMIVVYKLFMGRVQDRYNRLRVLIYGTSDKSVAVVTRLANSTHYAVQGFLERAQQNSKYVVAGLPVYCFNSDDRLARLLEDHRIGGILFARDTEAQSEEEGLIKYCVHNDVKTLIVPDVDEVEDGQPLLHPREVKVEDLLGREEITISLDSIRSDLKDKVVMITGAAGSIGSELVRQVAGFGVKKIVLYDNAETPMHNIRLELEDNFKNLNFVPVIGDVRHKERLDFAFRTWHPQVVFHAAAYKHVPLMEENPCEAVLVNVFGSRNVADKCLEYGVEKMVMISTDKAVNPTNIMGCTKRLAEIYVQSLGLAVENGVKQGKTRFVTTRFGNVLGSNGSVIPRFREQIAQGGPVTVTHPEINRFFMTIPEACRLVMEAATMSTGNNIFVFDMGKAVKIDTLARRMISLAGFTPGKEIQIEYTGLRPGEKLYEEVLSNEENTLPSFHERIRVAKVRQYDYADAEQYTEELEKLARAVEIPTMVRLMKKIVPEYKSENSKFAALDQEEK